MVVAEREAVRIHAGDPRYTSVVDFLFDEAALLDSGELTEWIDLLTPDMTYRMPVRLTRKRRSEGSDVSATDIVNENLAALKVRAARLGTNFAWAEDPPSRTRHFVTNIRVWKTDLLTEVHVHSNVLVYRNRGSNPTADLYSGERQDTLRLVDGAWRLASRTVFLDQAVVGARNISVLL